MYSDTNTGAGGRFSIRLRIIHDQSVIILNMFWTSGGVLSCQGFLNMACRIGISRNVPGR